MHVLYLHQYFATRAGVTGTRSYEFSKYLLSRGHKVTMITSGRRNVPEMTVAPGRDSIEVDVEGIHVVPIAAAYNNPLEGTGMSGIQRMGEFSAFARLATKVGRRLPRPDIVFATHTPLTIGLPGMKLARHFGVPFVFEVRDVWPDGAYQHWRTDPPHRHLVDAPPREADLRRSRSHCRAVTRHEGRRGSRRRCTGKSDGHSQRLRPDALPS